MTLQSSKTIGGIGALLMVISPFLVSGFTLLVGLVGLILVLIAMKGLSDLYMDAGIFNNSLYGVIISIIGVVVFVAAIIATALSFFSDLGFDFYTDWTDPTAFAGIDWTQGMILDTVMAHVGALIISFVILFVFAVIAAIFYRKSLTTLSTKSRVGLFGTTGLILLIGAVLTIIFIGFFLIWIALILLTISFFQLKEESAQEPQMMSQ
jgi:uncharacterized membrane protein